MERLKSNIINKVSIDKESECWNFTGCIQSNGYARMTYKRKTMGAHRWSFIAFVGEIPKGADVCHKCDNRKCVNPSHLFIGTRKDNMQDCKNKGRIANGFMLPQTRLSDEDKQEILRLAKLGMKYSDIAERFGVSKGMAGRVCIGFGYRRNKSNIGGNGGA